MKPDCTTQVLLSADARFHIWAASWQMQWPSTPLEWVIGHGLGGYEADFPDVWVFPHHFGLEVLYNSGIIGRVAFAGAVVALGACLERRLRPGRRDLLLALALLAGVGLFTSDPAVDITGDHPRTGPGRGFLAVGSESGKRGAP